MKKILCAVIGAAMLITAVPAATYSAPADPETAVFLGPRPIQSSEQASGDMSLMAVPTGDITSALSEDEIDAISEAAADAFENQSEHHPENMAGSGDPEDYIEIIIPDSVGDISIYADESEEPSEGTGGTPQYTPRMNAARGIVNNMRSDNPEYFYFESGISAASKGDGKLFSLLLKYSYDEEEREERGIAIENKVREIELAMSGDGINLAGNAPADQFDKALWLHDYVINNIEYDWRAEGTPEERTRVKRGIDAALLDRLTVCEGYSGLYKYLLENVGVECVNVYSDTEQHEWSAVKIGDAWYYVDTTQDEFNTRIDENGSVTEHLGRLTHNFFLVNKQILLSNGTHRDGYITEMDESDMTFGSDFDNEHWHAYITDGTDSAGNPARFWNNSIVNTTVVFDGKNRYYGGYEYVFDENGNVTRNSYSAIYQCEAFLSNPKEFLKIDGGSWYFSSTNASSENYMLSDYYGGLGKFEGKLYFNTPDEIKCVNLPENGEPEASMVPEVVFKYDPSSGDTPEASAEPEVSEAPEASAAPEVSEAPEASAAPEASDAPEAGEVPVKRNIMGIFIDGAVLHYETDDCLLNTETYMPLYDNTDKSGIVSLKDYTVKFYDAADAESAEGDVLIKEIKAPAGSKLEMPDFVKYGYTVTGWTIDKNGVTDWDFERDIVNSDLALYAKTAEIQWDPEGLQGFHSTDEDNGLLVGSITADIVGFDDSYQENPSFILAVYNGDSLVAVRQSENGVFDLSEDDNIAYDDGKTTVKLFAWNSALIPYINTQSISVAVSGGDTSPAPSEEPEASISPAPSEEPEASMSPAPSEEPEASISPAPSEEPEASISPAPSEEPNPGGEED